MTSTTTTILVLADGTEILTTTEIRPPTRPPRSHRFGLVSDEPARPRIVETTGTLLAFPSPQRAA